MPTTNMEATAKREDPRRKRFATAEGPRQRLLAGMPVVEKRLQLAGIATAVLEGGDGPPVVLLHGPGEYAAKWLRIIPDLATSHRVIAPDLPGHGMSEIIEGPVDADRAIAWLRALIDETCLTPPVLVGQILGGAVAARFAIDNGSRLRCLVLSDALGLADFQPAPEFGAALEAFVTRPDEETHDRLWERCAFDLDTMRDGMGESWNWLRAYNLDRAQAPGLRPTQQGLMEQFGFPAIPPAELSRITVPTVLIWGRHDLATPLSVAETASARYGWPLHVVEGAADDPPIEQPEAFMRALRAILADVGAADSASETPAGTREAWDRIAVGYDRTNTPTQMWLGNEGLRRAGLGAGMRLLDVAAGSGALSIPAARLGAEVLAVDQSPVMLQLLGEHAGQEGLDIATRVMDGHALALDDECFDMAGSQFGVMLFPDMSKGISEMARVVKPGGRVLVIAYGDPHQIDFLNFLVRAVQAVRPDFTGPPMEPPPLPFRLSDSKRLRRELGEAGLRHVSVETIIESTAFGTGEELWDWIIWSNPIVEEVLGSLHLTEGERGVIRHRLEDMVRERAGNGSSAMLANPVNIGIGVK